MAKDNTSPEIKRLRGTHELWQKHVDKWNFYLSAYQGGEEFANGCNIHKHPRENEESYKERINRIHNQNYCGPIVDFFTHFIFSESIDRDGGSEAEFFQEFCKNVNRRGDDIDSFMRQVSTDAQVFGMSYVLVDAPPILPGVTISKADEQAAGFRPYWVLITPEEITDWVDDEFGKIVYAKRKQLLTKVNPGAAHKRIERYTEIYPDAYAVTDIDVTNSDKPVVISRTDYPNTLGEVPLVCTRYKRDKRNPHMGMSFLIDLAYNNREVMNLTSMLQEFLYRQAFNILVRQTDPNDVPEMEEGTETIGTANLMEYPKDANPPSYITPPSEPARFIQDERTRLIGEMYKIAAQDTMNELFNGEGKSGFSQAQSFSKTVPYISSRADALERTEQELMRLTVMMLGTNREWNGKIKYKDRYELTNLTDAITQLLMLVKDLQLPSETFVKAELKRLVNEYDGKLPSELLRKSEREIDSMDFSKWCKSQEESLLGRKNSPTEQQKPKSTGTMSEIAAESDNARGGTKDLK